MPPSDANSGPSPSDLISQRIAELGGWRGATLGRMRQLILGAEPGIVEDWTWATPIWSCGGTVCTGEAYQDKVQLTFAQGASLPDPARLFKASLEGNTRRALDLREGETMDPAAFQALDRSGTATVSKRTKA